MLLHIINQQNLDLVRADKRLTIKEVAKEQGISSDSCKGILTKHLGWRHVSAKFVPWLLTVKQKGHHLSVAPDFLKCAGADDNFFKNLVTGNETWICSYNPKTKQPSSQWITSYHRGCRKCTKFGAKQMLMLSLFLIKNVLFTVTVLHQATLQTRIFI